MRVAPLLALAALTCACTQDSPDSSAFAGDTAAADTGGQDVGLSDAVPTDSGPADIDSEDIDSKDIGSKDIGSKDIESSTPRMNDLHTTSDAGVEGGSWISRTLIDVLITPGRAAQGAVLIGPSVKLSSGLLKHQSVFDLRHRHPHRP